MDLKTLAWHDQEDARTTAIVRRHGWMIQYVGGACDFPGCTNQGTSHGTVGPPFAYTVGLFGLRHPELLIFGVSLDHARQVLDTLGDRIRAGEDLLPGVLITVEGWPPRIIPEHVPNPEEIVFVANRHYGLPPGCSVPVLQLSYDDRAGRFPWEPGYAAPEAQPRPGTFRA